MNKILHIPTYYPPHVGGIENVCHGTVAYLSSRKEIEQQVFCFSGERRSSVDEYEGVEVTRVGDWGKLARQSIAPGFFCKLRRKIRRFSPDTVVFHAPNPLAMAALLAVLPRRVKLILYWHSDIIGQKSIYPLVRGLERRLLRRADVIVATSARYVEGSAPLSAFRDKCVVIPNMVDLSRLARDAERVAAIRRRYRDKPLLLFVGRHVPYKGLDNLLQAVGQLRHDCEVVIGGEGPLSERLKRNYAFKNVHFVGRIVNEELADYYHASDVFLFPSVTKNEAFGVALAEAMYCRTPAVTYTIEGSGVNWVNLNGVTGIEVPNGDVAGLAAAIDRLLEDDALRARYGEAARRRVEEHMTLERISVLLDKLFL